MERARREPLTQTGWVVNLWFCVAVAIMFTLLRVLVRLQISRRLQVEDYLVIAATVLFILMGICCQMIVRQMFVAVALTYDEIPSTAEAHSDTVYFLKGQFAIVLINWTVLWCIKLSFLLFFRRLFVRTLDKRHYWWYGVLAFTILSYFACVGVTFGTCTPFKNQFRPGFCTKQIDQVMNRVFIRMPASLDITSDVLIIAMPMHLLWGLRMNIKQKLGVAAVLLLGLITIAIAVTRLIEVDPITLQADPIWLGFWSILECMVSILVACLPPLRTYLRQSSRGTANYDQSGASGIPTLPSEASRTTKRLNIQLNEVEKGITADATSGNCNRMLPRTYRSGTPAPRSEFEGLIQRPLRVHIPRGFSLSHFSHDFSSPRS